ncbi:MAG TPA: sigma-70 family RNA polymerase sigma factor [Planctomycetota bacterium]|nr:sigma-70 family RNA polymerase sigma factor [Planctomycetota bacterium]
MADAVRREITSHYEALRSQMSHVVHCPHQGADLVQEAYYRALRHLGRRDLPRDGRAWLGAIARNVVRSHFRSRTLHAAPVSLDDEVLVDEHGRDPARVDTPFDVDIEHLAQAIESLSPIRQALIIGFYFEGKESRELGKLYGMRHTNVSCQLHRARKRIRRWLLNRDEVFLD